jgi:hypothetical protein
MARGKRKGFWVNFSLLSWGTKKNVEVMKLDLRKMYLKFE